VGDDEIAAEKGGGQGSCRRQAVFERLRLQTMPAHSLRLARSIRQDATDPIPYVSKHYSSRGTQAIHVSRLVKAGLDTLAPIDTDEARRRFRESSEKKGK